MACSETVLTERRGEVETAKEIVVCPHCGADVMVTGFTIMSRVSETYMRLSTGMARLASTQRVDGAACTTCAQRLPVGAAELMRMA